MQSRNYGTGQISLSRYLAVSVSLYIYIQAIIVVYVFEAEFAAAMPNNLEAYFGIYRDVVQH